jgi:hypothetical protein
VPQVHGEQRPGSRRAEPEDLHRAIDEQLAHRDEHALALALGRLRVERAVRGAHRDHAEAERLLRVLVALAPELVGDLGVGDDEMEANRLRRLVAQPHTTCQRHDDVEAHEQDNAGSRDAAQAGVRAHPEVVRCRANDR